MSGLPKLPGFNFVDPTESRFNLPQTFDYCNGYSRPKPMISGVGGRELDINSVGHIQKYDPVRYDPSLTYGRTRSLALPQFMPHFALYAQKCLTFKAFFKQSIHESPLEYYRVRQVNIIYFLEDDTITVMEPRILNSGLDQGRLVRRGKIPKTESGDYWHWKDLAVGKDICIFGVVYHATDCDTFTREYMRSQGLFMEEREEMPPDPYIQVRQASVKLHTTKTPAAHDKLRRFLEYDGKVLKFDAVWDTRKEEFGGLRPYQILYFLADDTVAVKETNERNSGRDPFPLMLKRIKLPKVYTDRPITFPGICMELTDAEVTEYYQPKDFLVGETIFVLGRPMLLVDCDKFTKNYFKKVMCIDQKMAIEYKEKPKPAPPTPMPPYDGFGTLEDSLQNTTRFDLKPPRKDVLKQVINANKYLRYVLIMDTVHPEDTIRRFLLRFSLADDTCYIYEPPIRNSGILGGKYLQNRLLIKPGSDTVNPCYYTPADFYIGAVISVFEQRFKIIDADLYVYRYMQANPEKFPCEVIENLRNHMFNMGYLKDDIANQVETECQEQKNAARNAIGKELMKEDTDLEQCIKDFQTDTDPEYYKRMKAKILQEYEDSLRRTPEIPSHGIANVNLECAYPIEIGKLPPTECIEQEGQSYAPKHIDTPEEIKQKYYASILEKHHGICEGDKPIEYVHSEMHASPQNTKLSRPLMVSGVDHAKGACKTKSVRFVDEHDRCKRDKHDLCGLKNEKTPCNCTLYKK